MKLLQKLPGSVREPPGLEWQILKRLPLVTIAGTAIACLCFAYAYLFPAPTGGDSIDKYLTGVGIAAVATVLTLWTAVFTVAVGCAIVWIMKGPAYVADPYPLSDSEQPPPETGRVSDRD
jgi:hypothetical protein